MRFLVRIMWVKLMCVGCGQTRDERLSRDPNCDHAAHGRARPEGLKRVLPHVRIHTLYECRHSLRSTVAPLEARKRLSDPRSLLSLAEGLCAYWRSCSSSIARTSHRQAAPCRAPSISYLFPLLSVVRSMHILLPSNECFELFAMDISHPTAPHVLPVSPCTVCYRDVERVQPGERR